MCKVAKMDFKELFRNSNQFPKKCYICGKSDAKLEEDHLPPKCIFPRQCWSKLITVPICNQCHDKRDKDDEYFRDYMTLWCGKNVPDEVHKKRQKSWERRQAHKIGTLRNLRRVWKKLPSGLTVLMYELKGEMQRINPVLESIARGYYFYRWREIIPESVIRILMTKAPFVNKDTDREARFWFNNTVLVEIIPEMFELKLNLAQEGNINISNWFLEFYEVVQFYVQFCWEKKGNNQKQ